MEAAKDNEEKKSSKGIIIVAVLLALAIAVGTWIYLIKSNRFFGLGELMRPHLKDTPILCMLLPEVKDESDPTLFDRETLNQKYTELLNENIDLHKRVTELEQNAADYTELEKKYKIVVNEVENLTKELAKKQEAEKVTEDTSEEEKLKNLVKVYESMEAADAAKILEGMGELNISLVVDICKAMKTAKFSELMAEFDTDFAAILSERMVQ
ncbi:MAG: hypothetical protein J6M02_03385 [Clostridia bacterium]|nr:hypothetical protein [Clostridia bacterium]